VGATGPTGNTGATGATGATGSTGPANGLIVGSGGTASLGSPTNDITQCYFVGIGAAVTSQSACTATKLTQFPIPAGGAIKTFYVYTPTIGVNPQKVTFTVRVNGALTAATCVGTATGCSVTGLNIPVTAGALIDVGVAGNAGSAPSVGTVTWGIQYQ
jgi:hypothetical protein